MGPPTTFQSTPAQGGKPTIKLAFSSSPGYTDLPMLLALERLGAQGYGTESVNFHASEIAIESVAKGDTPLGGGSSYPALQAMQKNADLKFIGERNANEWVILSTPDIKKCSDLEGKRLAVHSEAAVSTAMVRIWLKENCPQTKPNIIIISGSDNRANALLAGQIDATPLELANVIDVENKAPGKYGRLADFASGLPNLSTSSMYVNGSFLTKNRAAMVDYVAEQIKVHREAAQNPQILKDAIQKYIPELAKNADIIIKGYAAINGFDVNGGLTAQRVKYTIDFFVNADQLKPGLSTEGTSDLSILNDALARVGRQ